MEINLAQPLCDAGLDTLAQQPPQRQVLQIKISSFEIGFGQYPRARFGLLPASAEDPDGLCPFHGGTPELSDVFNGGPSFASSSAIRNKRDE